MIAFNIIALLLTLSAAFAYVNYRYLRLPTTIGVMLLALGLSLALLGLSEFAPVGAWLRAEVAVVLQSIDFEQFLLRGLLGLLLFAGALHVDLADLGRQKGAITVLATVGTVASTFMVGMLAWWALRAIGLQLRVVECLLLGALISPTDPIAVIGIMKAAGAPKGLETAIAGESLFNDGIGVVIFIILYEIASGSEPVTTGHVALLLLKEAGGGAAFGLAAGLAAYQMLKRVNNYQVEVLITLALATGAYALANRLHLSGPIAVVVAGLLVGNHGRAFAMSDQTREHLDLFWELIDEILNVVLFVLIGLEVTVMPLTWRYVLAGLMVIPIALLARWVSVAGTVAAMTRYRKFYQGTVTIMTWAGLRGGISVALALSIPDDLGMPAGAAGSVGGSAAAGVHVPRNIILVITYAVVIFSIVVQGLTVGPLVRRKLHGETDRETAKPDG